MIDTHRMHSVGVTEGDVLKLVTYLVRRKEVRLWEGGWNMR